jgi:hypothetical protein
LELWKPRCLAGTVKDAVNECRNTLASLARKHCIAETTAWRIFNRMRNHKGKHNTGFAAHGNVQAFEQEVRGLLPHDKKEQPENSFLALVRRLLPSGSPFPPSRDCTVADALILTACEHIPDWRDQTGETLAAARDKVIGALKQLRFEREHMTAGQFGAN